MSDGRIPPEMVEAVRSPKNAGVSGAVPDRPRVLTVLHLLMPIHGTWSAVVLFLCLVQLLGTGFSLPMLILAASSAWSVVCCFGVWVPVEHRVPRIWAWLTGALFVKSAFTVAFAVTLLGLILYEGRGTRVSPSPELPLGELFAGAITLYATAVVSLTTRLFRARSWFGIKPREGWRTLLRQGGWSLAITLAVEAAFLALLKH